MPDYPRIPDPPAAGATDTRESYGLTLLAFVVRERIACTLTDEQIALALHVAPIASAVHVSVDADKVRHVDYRTQAADAVADAVRELSLCQRLRAHAIEPTELTVRTTPTVPTVPSIDGGSPVPRQPYPKTDPPAPAYAERTPVQIRF